MYLGSELVVDGLIEVLGVEGEHDLPQRHRGHDGRVRLALLPTRGLGRCDEVVVVQNAVELLEVEPAFAGFGLRREQSTGEGE